jgi:hypothetical protein
MRLINSEDILGLVVGLSIIAAWGLQEWWRERKKKG